MPAWLLLEASLSFSDKLKPIFTQKYSADLVTEESDVYYGSHFTSAPAEIKPGEHALVELVLRAFPQDPCTAFQVGAKILLKEGFLTRAEGRITRRWEHESTSTTIVELQKELAAERLQ